MLDPLKLRTLVDIADTGSIAAAARRADVTASAASQHITVLEAQLGVRLLERLPRSTRLTPAGTALAGAAVPILARLDEAERLVADVADLRRGELSVGTFASGVRDIVLPAVRAFTARHAGVEVALTEIEPEHAWPQVREGVLDVALVHRYTPGPPPRGRELGSRTVRVEPLLLAVPAGHPFAAQGQIRPDAAADESWIATVPGEGFQAVLEHVARRAGFTPRIRHRIDSYESARDLVAAGMGVCLVPAMAAAPTPGVAYVRFGEPHVDRTVEAVFRRSDPNPAVAAFVAALAATERTGTPAGRARTPA